MAAPCPFTRGPRSSTSGDYNIATGTTGLATVAAVYLETPATVSATQGGIPNQPTADLHVTKRFILLTRVWQYIHPRIYIQPMKTKVFKSGNSLAVRLPKELKMPCGTVSIRREGRRIIIEEATETGWPNGFFESIRITRKDFGREKTHYAGKT